MESTHVVLIEEHVQLHGADSEIRLVELVGNIPSERAELAPFLDQSVEETQSEEHLLEMHRLFISGEEVVVADRIRQVGSVDVQFQASRRLVRHFDSVLQNRNREMIRRVAGQPESEVRMDLFRFELLANLFQCSHPGYCKMAVLKDNPVTFLGSRFNHLHRSRSLTLTQRQRVQLVSSKTLDNNG